MAPPDAPAEAAAATDGGKLAPPRVTLLTLPDELISEIFGQVHAMYMCQKRNMPPTSYLCLNKRLSTLAQPIWLSVLSAPQERAKAESFFLGMIGIQDRLLHVRELEWTVHKGYPAYRVALVKSLRNLATLRLRATNVSAGPCEIGVWMAIVSFEKLQELVFLSPTTPFQYSYYPNLTTPRLECTPSDLKDHTILFSDLRLRLHQDEAVSQLRLRSLSSLEIVLDQSIAANPSNFVASLLLQIDRDSPDEPCPSLTRLSLAFKHVDVWLQLWETLSVCCRSSALSQIELHVPPELDLYTLDFDAWPNLQRLALIFNHCSSTSLAILCDFILGLGERKAFKLVGFDWRGDGSTEIFDDVPDDLLDYVYVPSLHLLLDILRRSTNVLELRLRSDEEVDSPEFRWTRPTSKDNFDVDSYDLA
ncbi:hypothetical protein BMF94_5049 [Rhodotorula taiwanensis]|uniref:F-box domain-containing protein n=1 Tax=Rhodotorula taiwanensis TaxID=741276 RepID=A0A2S5B558_9BASI|nr:hypothetical protein BMF94_5049 [Rhodotorula taiwanensis]